MNAEFWKKLRRNPREIAYWVAILAAVAAAAIFLLTSRGARREAVSAEATTTAGRTQSATATAEAQSQAATATTEARTPEAGD